MAGAELREVLPGVLHWTGFHEEILEPVSSYFLEPAGLVVDPMTPPGGAEAFAGRERPRAILLTTGLHTRHAERLATELGCPILVSREGAQRIGDALAVETYRDGDEVAPGVTAVRLGVLADDEYALHLGAGGGAIALADAVRNDDGTLGFFPDDLLGDDPQAVKDGLRAQLRRLLEERPFEHVLLAHGEPLIGDGREKLRAFAAA